MKKECSSLEKVIKYMDSRLDAREVAYVEKHLKKCERCSEEIKKAKIVMKALSEKGIFPHKDLDFYNKIAGMERELKDKGCILTEEMTDFLHHRVSPTRKRYIENHLKECDECKDFLEILRKVEKEYGKLKY